MKHATVMCPGPCQVPKHSPAQQQVAAMQLIQNMPTNVVHMSASLFRHLAKQWYKCLIFAFPLRAYHLYCLPPHARASQHCQQANALCTVHCASSHFSAQIQASNWAMAVVKPISVQGLLPSPYQDKL